MHPRAFGVAVLLAMMLAAGANAERMKTVRVSTGGFSIALPSSWVNVTSAAPSVLKKLEQVPAFKAFA